MMLFRPISRYSFQYASIVLSNRKNYQPIQLKPYLCVKIITMRRTVLKPLLLIAAIAFLSSCDRDFTDYEGDEMAMLNAWVQLHNIPSTALKPSGLYFLNDREGTGLSPQEGDYVIFSYKEKNLDGVVLSTNDRATAVLYQEYDNSYHYEPIFTVFNRVNRLLEGYGKVFVDGLYEGLSYMKEGGKATLIVPSKLAYGKTGVNYKNGSVKAYQSVIYEVELHRVVRNPDTYAKDLVTDYVSQHYPGLEPVNDTIYYIQLSPPVNEEVTLDKDSVAYVYYKGMFLDGFVFDTNIDSVAKRLNRKFSSTDSLKVIVGAGRVIKGFDMALHQMKLGEWGRVIVPYHCAYDTAGNSQIPPYKPLVFDIYFKSKGVSVKPIK